MAEASSVGWQPYMPDGSVASLGTEGRWLDAADDIMATDTRALQAERLDLIFPSKWPSVFKDSPQLKTFINKKLRGARCRAVGAAVPADAAAVAKARVALRPMHSFDNALGLNAALGWHVVKGFMVMERADGEQQSFVALRHWWCERDGVWIDATPSYVPPVPGLEVRRLLVESDKGEKLPSILTERRISAATGLARRLVTGGALSLARHLMQHGLPPVDADEGGVASQGKGEPEGTASAAETSSGAVQHGGRTETASASSVAPPGKPQDASRWTPHDQNSKWEKLAEYDDADDVEPVSAASRAEEEMRQEVERATAAALAAREEEGGADRDSQLGVTSKRIESLGFKTMKAEELPRYGMAAEREQDRVDEYEGDVARAEARLARGEYSDKWERMADVATVEMAQDERPQTKVNDMMREMMTSKENRAADLAAAQGVDSDGSIGSDEATGAGRRAEPQASPQRAQAVQPEPKPAAKDSKPAAEFGEQPAARLTDRSSRPAAAEDDDEDDVLARAISASELPDLDSEVARRIREAEARKAQGNTAFGAADDLTALACYRQALLWLLGIPLPAELTTLLTQTHAELPTRLRQRASTLLTALHCNRSAVLLRLGDAEKARLSASEAVVLAPTDVKPRRRRAAACSALGLHAQAIADLSAAWKRAPLGIELPAALAHAWRARMPALGTLLETETMQACPTAAAALCRALGDTGGKAREWLLQVGAETAGVLACSGAAALVSAAFACVVQRDHEGAVAALRASAFILGVGGTDKAERAIMDEWNARFVALVDLKPPESVVVGALQLCQALAMRRVANCAWLPESYILRMYKEGHSGTIRAAAEGVLVWMTRHPHTRAWMDTLSQVRAEPIVFKCKALHSACQIGQREFDSGMGWLVRHNELHLCEEETWLCLGDGSGA